MELESFLFILAQSLFMLLIAPLTSGITKKTKALMQNRLGASIFQDYYDLYKWWQKPTCVTSQASWVFLLAPAVYFTSVFVASLLLPNIFADSNFGDVFVFLYILAIGRLFMVLAGLDNANTFGGMGASREIFIATLIEPVMLLAMFSIIYLANSTMFHDLYFHANNQPLRIANMMSAIGFFMLLLAENGRIPVDNPDTHLELTMIHEGMILEYSGRSLAVIHCASMLKQLVFSAVFALLFFPLLLPLPVKLFLTCIAVGVVETLNNKIRLFRVPLYISISGLLIVLSLFAN